MPLTDAETSELLGLMRAAVVEGLAEAEATTRRPRGIPGTAVAIDGSSVWVEPDDDLDQLLEATLYSPTVTEGDSVLLLQLPPSGAFVVGPMAT